jgi:hypothetical protein
MRHCTDNVVPRAQAIQNFAGSLEYEGNSFPKMELRVLSEGQAPMGAGGLSGCILRMSETEHLRARW